MHCAFKLSHGPDLSVYIAFEKNNKTEHRAVSHQLVAFCVERRMAWRMLQSKVGVKNCECEAQKDLLADVDAGRIYLDEFFAQAH